MAIKDILIQTQSGEMSSVLPAAGSTVTGTSIPDPADTTTEPARVTTVGSEAGVLPMASAGSSVTNNGLYLVPIGSSTATQTFLMSVFAINRVNIGGTLFWTYDVLASFTCTLCTKAVSTSFAANHLYCDTITLTVGTANVSNEIISPTGNQAASILVDTKGAPLVGINFARNGSSVINNCFWRAL